MSYKKITSAVVAFMMLASMTALSASAEEESADAPEVIETQAPAPVETEAPAPIETQAPAPVETEAPAPVETEAPKETEISLTEIHTSETETAVASETVANSEKSSEAPTSSRDGETGTTTTTIEAETVSTASTAATTAESVNKNIAAPKMGDFIVTSGDSGSSAVISWSAVEGADGYEIQLVQTPENGKASVTSIPSTAKTAFQFDCGKEAMKATVRVRALKNGEKGVWAEKTVYLNGMKQEETTTKATTKATTKKTETTTTKKTETGKTESPKTSDSAAIPAVAGAMAVAMLAGAVTMKKKEK